MVRHLEPKAWLDHAIHNIIEATMVLMGKRISRASGFCYRTQEICESQMKLLGFNRGAWLDVKKPLLGMRTIQKGMVI